MLDAQTGKHKERSKPACQFQEVRGKTPAYRCGAANVTTCSSQVPQATPIELSYNDGGGPVVLIHISGINWE